MRRPVQAFRCCAAKRYAKVEPIGDRRSPCADRDAAAGLVAERRLTATNDGPEGSLDTLKGGLLRSLRMIS